MTYEAWRITYQDSEQAARAAFKELREMERSYSHQLGEISRLSDVVCEWVQSPAADPPSDIWESADEIMQYVDAARPGEGTKETRWAMHIIGPDDVIPCVGEFDALRRANQHNIAFAKLMVGKPSPNNPYCVAVAEQI